MDETTMRFEAMKMDCSSDKSRAEYLMGSALFHRDLSELLHEHASSQSAGLEKRIRDTLASCSLLEDAARDGRDDIDCPQRIPSERFDAFLRDAEREADLRGDIGRRMADLTECACNLLRRSVEREGHGREDGAPSRTGPAASELDAILSGTGPDPGEETEGGYLRLDVYTELCIALLSDVAKRKDPLRGAAETELVASAVRRAFGACARYMPDRLAELQAVLAELTERIEEVEPFKKRIETILELQKREAEEREREERIAERLEQEHAAAAIAGIDFATSMTS